MCKLGPFDIKPVDCVFMQLAAALVPLERGARKGKDRIIDYGGREPTCNEFEDEGEAARRKVRGQAYRSSGVWLT